MEAMFSKLLRISQVEEICAYLHASLPGLILDFDVSDLIFYLFLLVHVCALLFTSHFLRFSFCPLTDCAGPWDSLSTAHSALQEVTVEPRLSPLLSSHPASAPESPHRLHPEAKVCTADTAPPLTDHSSVRRAAGGRSTEQTCIIRGQGPPPWSGEATRGENQLRALPPKAVVGRCNERREICSPCCERKGRQTQAASSVTPWDPYVTVNLNGATPGGGDGHVSLQERLKNSGLRCPLKTIEDPPARSAAVSPGPWNIPGSDKLPGTLRSWTSTVSR